MDQREPRTGEEIEICIGGEWYRGEVEVAVELFEAQQGEKPERTGHWVASAGRWDGNVKPEQYTWRWPPGEAPGAGIVMKGTPFGLADQLEALAKKLRGMKEEL
jgi:hypothetical protein